MRILIVGASGATGRLLVDQLLNMGQEVRGIVRSRSSLPVHAQLEVVQAAILDMSDQALASTVRQCDAVASCLGHSMTLQGIWGEPRRLVTHAVQRLCQAINTNRPVKPVRFVLMNTAGNSIPEVDGPASSRERLILGTMRRLLPPQVDNEQAARYLHAQIGAQDAQIEWAIVRPDSLVDAQAVSEYEVYPSPTRSAILNPGQTSRINVAHFMASLITDNDLWATWKGKLPVIYNQGFAHKAPQ